MKVHDPENKFKLNEVWAYLSQDENGNEGILAVPGPDGTMMPLIGADKERLLSLRPIAQQMKSLTKKKIIIIKLSNRTDIGTL